MALFETDKTDIRFFLGYGMKGDDPSGINAYVHDNFFPLEDRLDHLTESEESRIKAMLDSLRDMEEEIDASRTTLNIGSAGQFTRNPHETQQRIALYNRKRKLLGRFLKVPLKGSSQGFIV